MKVEVEAYGLKIGVDNSVTKALVDGKWGIRFSLLADNNDSRCEFVIPAEEAEALITKIQQSLNDIAKVKAKQKQAG